MEVQTFPKLKKMFYGWFILAAALIMTTISLIPKYSFSVFYTEILKEFGWSRASTAGALSLAIIVFGLISPAVGALVDKFGPRTLLLIATIFSVSGLLSMSQIQNIGLFYLAFGVITPIGTNALGTNIHNTYLAIRRTGSYVNAFIIAIAAATVSCAFFWLSSPRKVRTVPGKAPKPATEQT
jgi:MFS family permease